MDVSAKTKRNRAKKKRRRQAKKASQMKTEPDHGHVSEEQPQLQEKLPEPTPTAQTITAEIMSSNPSRPVPSTPAAPPTATNQDSTPAGASASSTTSEITERLAATTVQSTRTGPPISIQPKPELSRAERRAIQEAQRAAKQQKVSGTPTAKSSDSSKAPPTAKRQVPDHTPTPSVSSIAPAPHRPHSEAGESVLSNISRSTRVTPNALPGASTTQSAQKRSQNKANDERLTLFAHLTIYKRDLGQLRLPSESKSVHPAIIKLGLQYATRQISGSNLRCVAFLVAIRKMLEDYEGVPGSSGSSILNPVDLNTKLKMNINFLTKCRPNAVTMGTAIRHLKTHIERIPHGMTNEKAKELLDDVIRSFVREKIELSGIAIAETYAITKITNGDVILIFGYSSLIIRILETAIERGIDFRVIIVDSRPQQHGLKSARRLLALNVKCTYILINAVPFIISEVTKVLLGAHGLLGNGYVMSQVGTAQISLIAKTHNVPVLVCCETYKFCERVQTDSFVFNELGDPNDLVADHPALQVAMSSPASTSSPSTSSNPNLNILNMTYDVTPPTFISAVITELGILPCTSVAVVIRMQNKQLDDICGQEHQSITATTTNTNSLPTLSDSIE